MYFLRNKKDENFAPRVGCIRSYSYMDILGNPKEELPCGLMVCLVYGIPY